MTVIKKFEILLEFDYCLNNFKHIKITDFNIDFCVFRIIQTIYTSVGVVATLAQYPHDVHASRLSAQRLDDHIELTSCIEDGSSSRKSSTSSTDSEEYIYVYPHSSFIF